MHGDAVKALLVLLALGATASAEPTPLVVHLRGEYGMPIGGRSCGAEQRLLADTYLIDMWADRAEINRTPWTVVSIWGGGAVLEHRSEPDAITRETLFIAWGEPRRSARAELILMGATEEREPCSDRVRLTGIRER